jgi:ssDNA-binding Zn-finger/Zn-ribbon topoisomerase 1
VILKEKEFSNSLDVKIKAGEAAEKQMAFYLNRAFRKNDDCFVINDLRIIHDEDVAQIDHLIVSKFGLFIIESKSIHGTISINRHGEWKRTYGTEVSGIPSPVIQAREQGKILKEMLRENAELTLGKVLFGKIQKGYGYCPVIVYVAISDSGIIERDMEIPELFKADTVSTAISNQLNEYSRKTNIFAPQNILSIDVPWAMSKQEAQATAEFLLSRDTPLRESNISKAATKGTSMQSEPSISFVPKVGASCPVCGKEKLVRKSINRSDGTETDFLACQGYPNNCKAIFPLVALAQQTTPKYASEAVKPNTETIDGAGAGAGAVCPKCGVGKKVRRKGKNGKPDFFGCSNYGKTKCGYMEVIAEVTR